MKSKLRKCLQLLLLILPLWAAAQQRTIRGKVTDAKDGGPLAGVTVSSGTGTARVDVTTNDKGEFSIALAPGVNELTFSYVGYKDIVEKVNARGMVNVVMNIGGIYTDNKTTEQDGQVYTPVPKARQKEALNYLQKNVFETPTWLLNKSILDKITSPNSDRVSTLQDNVLASLLANTRLQRMISSNNRDANSYRIDEYFDDLKKGLWTELVTKKPIDNYRRNLQKSFVERLGTMVSTTPSPASGGFVITFGPPAPDPKKSDIPSVARGTLRALRTEISATIPTVTDRMSRYHLQDVADRIDHILDPK